MLPYSKTIFNEPTIAAVPSIHFGTGTASLLLLMKEAGSAVIGVDWQTPLDKAWAVLDHQPAIQGNLDPAALFADNAELERRVNQVLDKAGGRPGHIFNLGHGILPQTPVDNVKRTVDLVHQKTGR